MAGHSPSQTGVTPFLPATQVLAMPDKEDVNARHEAGHDEERETAMKRSDLTEKLLDIKREKGWSWKHICEKIGGYSEVLIVGAIMGQMKLTKPQAANAGELFGL